MVASKTTGLLRLDRGAGRLFDSGGRIYLPDSRRWHATADPPAGEPVTPAEALAWLQRESAAPWRPPAGVIGPREATPAQLELAEVVGRGLAGLGLTLLSGGREGVMEAACRGAANAGGITVGLLPDESWSAANPFVTVPIATGIGVARNAIIARAAFCLIAIGGGVGTLSEVAFALQFKRPVFGLADAPRVDGVVALEGWPALEARLCRLVLGLDERS